MEIETKQNIKIGLMSACLVLMVVFLVFTIVLGTRAVYTLDRIDDLVDIYESRTKIDY